MRFRASAFVVAAVSLAALGGGWYGLRETDSLLATSCAAEPAKDKPPAKPPALPPLVIDKNAPLLLDEAPKGKAQTKDPLLINESCYVCHNNYKDEPLAVSHAKEGVGCIKCHGDSFDHRNDEDNITPPQRMYPAEAIDAACAECHDSHDAPATKVLARWRECCPQKTDVSTIVCTDCHGKHRLERRTVRWDKKTGKLLVGKEGAPKRLTVPKEEPDAKPASSPR
jgi:hypothetical protein